VRREAARYALAAMTAREPVTDWIIDDTGFPEAGHALRGRATTVFGHNRQDRQLPGGGQLDHCHTHGARAGGLRAVPAESWTEDPSRRAEAHIPDEVTFKTKPELGGRDDRACHCGRVAGWAGAGRQRVWRQLRVCAGACAAQGLATPSAYNRTTTVWRLDLLGRRIGDPVAVGDLADAIGRGGFRR